ncbi:glycosyltransferase [Thalassotalea sp. M1531]|uniref:Glycosyltransferase n=1 Tax=Thalassotalea algicola TaxID=2716224 RepID=A0A7Y0LCL3_9GAMM|nr:glycosyltransferase [Thalassotalea algicola]NMP32094.1 glycosyltransferase [Thalassotalea algicola]
MKASIVHIVQHLKPGGIESFALEFQRAASAYYNVHIISLERSNCQSVKGKYHEAGQFVHILNKAPGWQPSIILKIKELLKSIDPMYVHTHHIGPLIYGGLAARLSGIDCVIHTEHDAWHLMQTKRRLLQDCFLKVVRPVFVADADFVAKQIKTTLPDVNPYVIANGVDTEHFTPTPIAKHVLREQAGLPKELKFVGCAARLEPVKSHDTLIDAVAKLPESVGLLLAGDGSLKEYLLRKVKKMGLLHRIFFLGHIEDMRSFYQLLDVFCLSSSNEGLPLAPMEAQACNIPVVITDVGGSKEAICNSTGHVVAPNDSIQLSKALFNCLNKQLVKSPREFVERERSIKTMITQYITLSQPSLRGKL